MLLNILKEKYNFSEQINNYTNNNKFKLLEMGDLNCYEVCNRENEISLAIWMKNTNFVRTTFIPSVIENISWLTHQQIQKMNDIIATKLDETHHQFIVVNFDEYNKYLRLYFSQDAAVSTLGYDINVNGIVEKYKEYKVVNDILLTMHYQEDKLIKISENSAKLIGNGISQITRLDTNQKYVLYYKNCNPDDINI